MATKETLYGRLTVVLKNNVQIDNLQSTGLKQATGSRNVTTKDSNDVDESRPTVKSQSIDFKFLASSVAALNAGYQALQTSRDNRTIEVWKYSTGVPGANYWSASGYITALDFDANHDDTLSCSGTVQLTGDVTFGTV